MRSELFHGMREKDYANLLAVKLLDPRLAEKHKDLLFAVTPNFDIYITHKPHAYLTDNYGVDLDATLTEGYIRLNDIGEVKEIKFKPAKYQPVPGFQGTGEELNLLQAAVREKIRKAF